MGTVHNRTCGNRSLVPAGTALVNVAAMNGIVFHTAALRADKPIGKAQAEQLCSASVLGIVATAKLFESNLSCTCHDDVPLFAFGNIVASYLSNKSDFLKILWLAVLSR